MMAKIYTALNKEKAQNKMVAFGNNVFEYKVKFIYKLLTINEK